MACRMAHSYDNSPTKPMTNGWVIDIVGHGIFAYYATIATCITNCTWQPYHNTYLRHLGCTQAGITIVIIFQFMDMIHGTNASIFHFYTWSLYTTNLAHFWIPWAFRVGFAIMPRVMTCFMDEKST